MGGGRSPKKEILAAVEDLLRQFGSPEFVVCDLELQCEYNEWLEHRGETS
jgi:hypothetical protein